MDVKDLSAPGGQAEITTDDIVALPSSDAAGDSPIPSPQLVIFDIADHTAPLSSTPHTNTKEELSIPREIISSSVSSTSMQSEILRPLIAGTYNSQPAYLIQLQFQFQTRGPRQSWLNRIQSAAISIVAEDAPLVAENPSKARRKRLNSQEALATHPAIMKTYPGTEGWEGPISRATRSREVGVELQGGWMGVGAGVFASKSIEKEEKGRTAVTTMRTGGKHRNRLLVTVVENPVDAAGVPAHLVIPVILVHHTRRFSLRVTVKATFGLWRGKIAESFPVLGKADEPLYFDPKVIDEAIETGKRGLGGVNVGVWKGELSEVELSEYSSL